MNNFSKSKTCTKFKKIDPNIIFQLDFMTRNKAEKVFEELVELLESNQE